MRERVIVEDGEGWGLPKGSEDGNGRQRRTDAGGAEKHEAVDRRGGCRTAAGRRETDGIEESASD